MTFVTYDVCRSAKGVCSLCHLSLMTFVTYDVFECVLIGFVAVPSKQVLNNLFRVTILLKGQSTLSLVIWAV